MSEAIVYLTLVLLLCIVIIKKKLPISQIGNYFVENISFY